MSIQQHGQSQNSTRRTVETIHLPEGRATCGRVSFRHRERGADGALREVAQFSEAGHTYDLVRTGDGAWVATAEFHAEAPRRTGALPPRLAEDERPDTSGLVRVPLNRHPITRDAVRGVPLR